ncbi:hypothetical protein [Granulicella sibirica]|uniref:Uncharacterized protein n=1 Tax=Granulicella sibirica TaxID=2479048 RepID=A0A4Q0T221_9BACT|nr:hypothetical protein [Granulicella sibirica]RXH57237.1 hypothetical protein GRAN_0547 [Granulicella sibirica]
MKLRLLRFAASLWILLGLSLGLAPQAAWGAPSSPADRADASPPIALPDNVTIPGPLASFLRLAGISQKIAPAEVLPLLTRNVYLQGFQNGQPTEFLRLLDRYVAQARELQILAGQTSTIRVTNCADAGTLIQILGYRLRNGCGDHASLETANPERAFLTIDSNFPLTDLEEALQKGTPFVLPYQSTHVPALFHESDWISLSAGQRQGYSNLIDILINDPAIARLYWAFSKMDVETRNALQTSLSLRKLLPFNPTLDFYGSQISIRSGRVLVPGGPTAEPAWKSLAGASPDSPSDFTMKLLARDNGWLAAYFDVLSRVSPEEREHLTAVPRLQHLYEDFHTADTKGNASIGVFRHGSDLLILDTRVSWDANGQPHVPGNLEAWRQILSQHSNLKIVREYSKRSRSLDQPEQLLEEMTAFARIRTDTGPLQLYLTLCEIDRGRAPGHQLSPQTVTFLSSHFTLLSNWLLTFSEFPALDDESIVHFVNVAASISKMPNQALHSNVLGAFQANIGLWEILARQGQIPTADLNASWQKTIQPFAKIASPIQLFDATTDSVKELLVASGAPPNSPPSELIDRLAGPVQNSPDGQRMHDELASRIRSVLEDQRLVSLDTLFALSDGLTEMQKGSPKSTDALLALAGELREFEMPRQIFTNSEKINWAPAVYTSHHAELQVQTDLTKVIKAPGTRAQLEAARGQLAPFLRDTLVGLNYAYYEPPGAQILHINPLFVRSHDFLGISVIGSDLIWQPPVLLGAGISAGGGAYLMGSLADLPYSLATAEADFIVPENVQALIWRELVPDMLADASFARWWNVTPDELHAVGLYQRAGEELLRGSEKDPQLRARVASILSVRMDPRRLERISQALPHEKETASLLPLLMPADTFYLAAEYRKLYPGEAAASGPAGKELQDLCQRAPAEANWEHLSRDFGVAHPTLAHTNARDLLNLQPFPYSGGYTSRLFGESLESNNLYWARLADEMGYPPVMLNRLVPELTRHMISKIFATDLEDWPAMVRAMHETGDDLRRGKIASLRKTSTPSTEQAENIVPAQ